MVQGIFGWLRDSKMNFVQRLINSSGIRRLVFREIVNFANTMNYLATQINNETSFKQHNKEIFIIVAGVKEWEWESVPG